MQACDGGVRGTCAYARENTTPSRAKSSRCGVSPRFDPKKPIRSARVVSSVTTMMFGRTAEEVEDCGKTLGARQQNNRPARQDQAHLFTRKILARRMFTHGRCRPTFKPEIKKADLAVGLHVPN